MDFRGLVWKRVWKLKFLVWDRIGEPGGTPPPRIPRSIPPGAGPSITYLFSFGMEFNIWTNLEPVSRKAWKLFGFEGKFWNPKQTPWSRTSLTWSFKQVLAFLKFCTLGQKDFKIHVVSVLVFLLIAGAHSHFYINTSLICRFWY